MTKQVPKLKQIYFTQVLTKEKVYNTAWNKKVFGVLSGFLFRIPIHCISREVQSIDKQ